MTEMFDPTNPRHVGPQVTARPGTKRHLKQVRARCVFTAIHTSSAAAAAKRAQAAYEAAQAELAITELQLEIVTTLLLAITPAAGEA